MATPSRSSTPDGKRPRPNSAPEPPDVSSLVADDRCLVALVDAASAEATAKAGAPVVCGSGCAPCCFGPFSITPLDAWRLRRGLDALASTAADTAHGIVERARATAAAQTSAFAPEQAGQLRSEEEERRHYKAFANVPCPALCPDSGTCLIYEWRPLACRTHGPPLRRSGYDFPPCPLCFKKADPALVDEMRLCLDVDDVETPLVERVAAEEDNDARTTVTFALAAWSGSSVSAPPEPPRPADEPHRPHSRPSSARSALPGE